MTQKVFVHSIFILTLILLGLAIGVEMASKKGKKTILKFDSEEDVGIALAKYTADLSEKFINEKCSFSVVLSGGSLIETMR